MRLYLSSFRMGDHPDYLAALAGESGRGAVVIANALDDAPAGLRRSGVENELAGLAGLGVTGRFMAAPELLKCAIIPRNVN
jgi:dipeptidase E